jgi:hypothetical protein
MLKNYLTLKSTFMKFLKLTLVLFLGILFISIQGCNKDECKNIVCLNGGACESGFCNCPPGYTGATCGIAKTPVSVTINNITVNRYPMTNPSGAGWDAFAGNGPDIVVTINAGTSATSNGYVSNTTNNLTGSSFSTSSGLPITLITPSSNYTVGLWDEDTLEDVLMTGVYFIPNNFATNFPSNIRLTTSSVEVTLNVVWNF